ncbi:hypothetical protein KC335_g75 [Hortaea werneckii]|nr:hypothetical protein KC335_g75 [Hortaea werneckii]
MSVSHRAGEFSWKVCLSERLKELGGRAILIGFEREGGDDEIILLGEEGMDRFNYHIYVDGIGLAPSLRRLFAGIVKHAHWLSMYARIYLL